MCTIWLSGNMDLTKGRIKGHKMSKTVVLDVSS
jgi:hypothetical protein